VAVALCLGTVATAACTRLLAPAPPPAPPTLESMLAALGARERSMEGLRVSMSLRGTGRGGATLPSPAYLAIDGPGRLRLEVLSPFGMTVLALAIDGDEYTLVQPLRGETRRSRVDPKELLDPDGRGAERMIVALALLFRPKIAATNCRLGSLSEKWAPPAKGHPSARAGVSQDAALEPGAAATASRSDSAAPSAAAGLTCALDAHLSATVLVDRRARPTRESYALSDGTTLLIVEYADYAGASPTALPGRIVIRDPASDATLIARVLRTRASAQRGFFFW